MRIKIFAHPNSQIVEDRVNKWLAENENTIKIIDFIYHDYRSRFSVLIKYTEEI